MIVVSIYCDDDDYVITDNCITDGYWGIGDPATDIGDVITSVPAGDLWPHQVVSWIYWTGDKWQSDPQLTVTGNIGYNIFVLILIFYQL